jgi:hypothetical protein
MGFLPAAVLKYSEHLPSTVEKIFCLPKLGKSSKYIIVRWPLAALHGWNAMGLLTLISD